MSRWIEASEYAEELDAQFYRHIEDDCDYREGDMGDDTQGNQGDLFEGDKPAHTPPGSVEEALGSDEALTAALREAGIGVAGSSDDPRWGSTKAIAENPSHYTDVAKEPEDLSLIHI